MIFDGGRSGGEQDAARLLDSYAGPPGNDVPMAMITEIVPARPEGCGYKKGELDQALDRDVALIHLARSAHDNEAIQYRRAMVDAVEQRTTAFGRGFLAACLQAPGYRALCHATAGEIVDEARTSLANWIAASRQRDHVATGKAICTYFDGLRAKDIKAGFLPQRTP